MRRAERRAAPKPARASRVTGPAFEPSVRAQARTEPRLSLPSGAEPGHGQSGGLTVTGEGLRHQAQRGPQDRPTYPTDEGPS